DRSGRDVLAVLRRDARPRFVGGAEAVEQGDETRRLTERVVREVVRTGRAFCAPLRTPEHEVHLWRAGSNTDVVGVECAAIFQLRLTGPVRVRARDARGGP